MFVQIWTFSTCHLPSYGGDLEEQHRLRYTTFIGDGDSKGFTAVTNASPYGPDVAIEKEECVGHVQKRVGTNLRKLKKELSGKKLSDNKTIGGRGRLTDGMIDSLQNYYGMAVRANAGDLQAMSRAIWASLMHRVSTDEKPQHQYCPPGIESWCGWQAQQAGGEVYEHHNILPKAIFEVIKPLYIRLTDKALLRRCLRGATQNQNDVSMALYGKSARRLRSVGLLSSSLQLHLPRAGLMTGLWQCTGFWRRCTSSQVRSLKVLLEY